MAVAKAASVIPPMYGRQLLLGIAVFVAHPLGYLSHVLSVLPAGKHVGEGEWLQAGVNQIRLLRLLLVLICRRKSSQ